MTDPAITAALEKLIADTSPPVTVWGVRYPEPTAGYIDWGGSEAEAREWLADGRADGVSIELVRVTGRLHVEG